MGWRAIDGPYVRTLKDSPGFDDSLDLLGGTHELGIFKAHNYKQESNHRGETVVALVPDFAPLSDR